MLDLKKLLINILTSLRHKVDTTGDTMTGNLTVDNAHIDVNNSNDWAYIGAQGINNAKVLLVSTHSSQNIGLYDQTNSNWIVQHTNNTNKTVLPALTMSSSTTGTVGSSFSGAAQKYCYLYKIGKIVFMSMSLGYSDNSTTITTNTTLFTVPTGYRPAAEARLPAQIDRKTSAQSYPASITVATDGQIQQNTSSAATGIYCFGMWETS